MGNSNFRFVNGAVLNIDENNITLSLSSDKNIIETKMLDTISYNLYFENRISPGGLYQRMFWIPLTATLFLNWKFSLMIYVYLAILVVIFVFDTMLELNLCRSIVNRYFSNNYYHVEISSKTGKNINFYVSVDELNKIKNVEKSLIDLKKHLADNTVKTEVINYYDDLKKLNDLLNSGIITQQEFDLKKTQILGI